MRNTLIVIRKLFYYIKRNIKAQVIIEPTQLFKAIFK